MEVKGNQLIVLIYVVDKLGLNHRVIKYYRNKEEFIDFFSVFTCVELSKYMF